MDMNSTHLVGRRAADPRFSEGAEPSKNRCWFVLAVGRRGEGADFIPCVAWGARADAVAKHCRKGKEVAVDGRLHSYRNGEAFTLEVNVSNISFGADPKKGSAPEQPAEAPKAPAVNDAGLAKIAMALKALLAGGNADEIPF